MSTRSPRPTLAFGEHFPGPVQKAPTEELPRVTYVVSCFNHEAYIEACIRSVLAQSYPNIELLVYDDGSADRSASLLHSLSQNYGFYFKNTGNRGYSATLNDALTVASGEYFCPLGSDDIALPEKTTQQVRFLSAHPEMTVCTGGAQIIDDRGQPVGRQETDRDTDFNFDDLFNGQGLPFVSSSAMFRTRALRDIGGFNEDLPLEDLYVFLKLAAGGNTVYNLHDTVVQFRSHRHNTSRRLKYMYTAILETLADYRNHERYSAVVSSYSIRFLRRALREGDNELAQLARRHIRLRDYDLTLLRRLVKSKLQARQTKTYPTTAPRAPKRNIQN